VPVQGSRAREGLVVGGAIAGGVAVGLLLADRVLGSPASGGGGSTATAGSGAGSPTGIGVMNPAPGAAVPSSSSTAPTVTNLQATPLSGGATTLTWTGTLVTEWTQPDGRVADSIGYDLYVQRGGRWVLVEPEVYPPLRVTNLQAGDTLGVAPVYVLADGTVVAGAISPVTVVG
jgi:hypothetical protein